MSPGTILSTAYKPVAIYFEEADTVEYVREDVVCVYRRVDPYLTLIFAMSDLSKPIGFSLKGFKHVYLSAKVLRIRQRFVAAVQVIERISTLLGDELFKEGRELAYEQALEIARDDAVDVEIAA